MKEKTLIPQWKKSLEGTLWILDFEADYTVENGGNTQTLFAVNNAAFRETWEPLNDWNCVRPDNLERMRAYLHKGNVKELYTLDFPITKFLGYTLDHQEEDFWYRYEPLGGIGDTEHAFRCLGFEGIALNIYDTEKHEITRRIRSE